MRRPDGAWSPTHVLDRLRGKDGLGPALDSFAKALNTVNVARQKQSKHVKQLDGKSVYSPHYREVSEATDKARKAMTAKATRLERVVADCAKLCDTNKAKPAPRCTTSTSR